MSDKLEREAGLLEYLDQVKGFMPGGGLAGLVRDNGKPFLGAPLPADVERGEMKMCFQNALLLALSRSDLIYVEGYACHFFPTLHAWCVTKEGVVVDPTWDEPEECAYFGIPFQRKFASRTVYRNKVYGLLADPATASKLFKLPPAKYRDLTIPVNLV